MLRGAIVLLVLVGSMSAISCMDIFPMDCSRSKAAEHPSAGRQACLDLSALVERQTGMKSVGGGAKLKFDDDVVFNCVCGLSINNIQIAELMSHPLHMMLLSIEDAMYYDESSTEVQRVGLYKLIKLLAKQPTKIQGRRRNFLTFFKQNYRSMETGNRLDDTKTADEFAQEKCYELVNHPVVTDFIEPTLEALHQWLGGNVDKYFPLVSNSNGLLNILNLKNFCVHVIGLKEVKSSDDKSVVGSI